MGTKKHSNAILMVALACAIALSPAPARADAAAEKAAIQACQKSTVHGGGQMPWGVTDQDLISYKGSNVCTYSGNRPVAKNCRRTMEKLYNVASEINKMVKSGCEKYVPIFAKLQAQTDCTLKGPNSCFKSNNAQMKELKSYVGQIKQKLNRFYKKMEEAQVHSAQASQEVADTLQQIDGAKKTNNPTAAQPALGQMGVSSISQSDELNSEQDAQVAQALVREIQEKFKNSNYDGVTEDNYKEKLQPISDAFKKVESEAKSKILREQLHGFLKAEEVKLGMKLFESQNKGAEKATDTIMATNEESTRNLGPVSGSQGGGFSVPQMSAAGGGAPSLSGSGEGAGGAPSGVGGATYDPDLSGGKNAVAFGSQGTPSKGFLADIPETPVGEAELGDDATISASSASRAPASSLKDSLRKKLADKIGSGAATGSSQAEAGTIAATEENKARAAAAGIRGVNGDSAFDQGTGGVPDPLLEGFEAKALEEQGFSLEGPGTDASVKELVGEFKATLLGESDNASNEIGASDGPSLFTRVKELHGRCLKRGCVVGLARGVSQ